MERENVEPTTAAEQESDTQHGQRLQYVAPALESTGGKLAALLGSACSGKPFCEIGASQC